MEKVLTGKVWIAVYAPENGLVDRIEIDLDCKDGPEGLPGRDQRYWAIREVFGMARRPLVIQTPSEWGLHVSYRIPLTRLEEINTGLRTGLVADVLRAAGLPVEQGSIEIFPQATQCKRLPVGRAMAILDPDTLEPMARAPDSPRTDSRKWQVWGDLLSKWHSVVYEDLIPHLRSLPQDPDLRPPTSGPGEDDLDPPVAQSRDLGGAARELVATGLTRPSSRNEIEFRVGTAIWRDPELFQELGARRPLTREIVARTLATWLSLHHNDLSEEWRADLRRASVGAVIETWTTRFLRPDSQSGMAPVDRMLKAAQAESWDCGLVAPGDMAEILDLGLETFSRGHLRYQFEIWTCALLRAVKAVARHHRALGNPVTEGDEFVEIELQAGWMERWPWGGGRIDGVRSYVRFRDALVSKGWVVPVSRPVWYVKGPERPGVATRYRVRTPLDVHSSELPFHRDTVEGRIVDLTVHGRSLSVEEAYHALTVTQNHLQDPERRYGTAIGRRVRSLAKAIRDPLGTTA